MKRFENIEIKNLITIVALLIWVGSTIYGFYAGEFTTVFDFFKECFLMIISFYLGTKVKTNEQTSVEDLSNVDIQEQTEEN